MEVFVMKARVSFFLLSAFFLIGGRASAHPSQAITQMATKMTKLWNGILDISGISSLEKKEKIGFFPAIDGTEDAKFRTWIKNVGNIEKSCPFLYERYLLDFTRTKRMLRNFLDLKEITQKTVGEENYATVLGEFQNQMKKFRGKDLEAFSNPMRGEHVDAFLKSSTLLSEHAEVIAASGRAFSAADLSDEKEFMDVSLKIFDKVPNFYKVAFSNILPTTSIEQHRKIMNKPSPEAVVSENCASPQLYEQAGDPTPIIKDTLMGLKEISQRISELKDERSLKEKEDQTKENKTKFADHFWKWIDLTRSGQVRNCFDLFLLSEKKETTNAAENIINDLDKIEECPAIFKGVFSDILGVNYNNKKNIYFQQYYFDEALKVLGEEQRNNVIAEWSKSRSELSQWEKNEIIVCMEESKDLLFLWEKIFGVFSDTILNNRALFKDLVHLEEIKDSPDAKKAYTNPDILSELHARFKEFSPFGLVFENMLSKESFENFKKKMQEEQEKQDMKEGQLFMLAMQNMEKDQKIKALEKKLKDMENATKENKNEKLEIQEEVTLQKKSLGDDEFTDLKKKTHKEPTPD